MEDVVPGKRVQGVGRWTQDIEDALCMRQRELVTSRESIGQAMKRATFHKEPAT